jgi:hypothetical protein
VSTDPVETLKHRLASGDILISEYNEILKALKAPTAESTSLTQAKVLITQGIAELGGASGKVWDSVFGEDSYQPPTDTCPLVINDRLEIFGSFLTFEGKKITFTEILSVGFKASSLSINLIPARKSSRLSLILNSGRVIELKCNTMIITGGENKRMRAASELLCAVTRERRINTLRSRLLEQGYTNIDKIRLAKDGMISNGSAKVNLKVAAKKNLLWIGTTRGGNVNGSENPYEVAASENGGIFASRISFEVFYDRDIFFPLIRELAGLN